MAVAKYNSAMHYEKSDYLIPIEQNRNAFRLEWWTKTILQYYLLCAQKTKMTQIEQDLLDYYFDQKPNPVVLPT